METSRERARGVPVPLGSKEKRLKVKRYMMMVTLNMLVRPYLA